MMHTQPLRRRWVFAAFALAFFALSSLLAACGDDDDDDAGDDDDQADDDDDDTEPAVQVLLDEYVAVTAEPGIAVAWTQGGATATAMHAGDADMLAGVPLEDGSLFRVGSDTKPFVAALTMQLVDEDLVALDEPIATYLPEYTQWPGLTVRHLLAMRSGVRDYLDSFNFWLFALTQQGVAFTPEQLVGYALEMDPEFAPDADCSYSDTNYVLLGMIVERVTGQALADVLRQRIFDPLGMTATYLDLAGQVTALLAHGYADVELAGPLMNIDDSLLALIEVAAPQFTIEGTLVDTTYMIHPTFSWAAGGIVSNPAELATFMGAWVRGELASAESMAEVMDFGACEILGEGVQYGLGLERDETAFGDAIGHGGLNFGYATMAYHLVDADLTFAVSNNFLPEQTWYVRNEMLGAMIDPATPGGTACVPPDWFLDESADDLLQVRFRGPVVDIDSGEIDDEATGLSGSRLRYDGRWWAYNGYGAYAYAADATLAVESIGPPRTDEWDARQVSLELADALYDLLDETGYAEIGNDRSDLFVPLAADISESGPGGTLRMCYTAVPDPSAATRFFSCDTDPATAQVGDIVKVFANVPMSRDAVAIEAYTSDVGLSPCLCFDADWNWTPC